MTLLKLNTEKKWLQNKLKRVEKKIKEAQHDLPNTRTKKIFTQNDYHEGGYVQTFDLDFWCKILYKHESGLSIDVDGEVVWIEHHEVTLMRGVIRINKK